MKLHELKATEGSRQSKHRVGRGVGSGSGKTSGKGQKGQNSRSGGGVRLAFEGGQTPLHKRVKRKGFTNYTRKEYAIVNVSQLNKFEDGTEITVAVLKDAKVIKSAKDGLKILADGEITKKLTVKANKVSEAAKSKIEAAGGTVEVL